MDKITVEINGEDLQVAERAKRALLIIGKIKEVTLKIPNEDDSTYSVDGMTCNYMILLGENLALNESDNAIVISGGVEALRFRKSKTQPLVIEIVE